eukprot:361821-Chlamydomonas_euryale.AAC.5
MGTVYKTGVGTVYKIGVGTVCLTRGLVSEGLEGSCCSAVCLRLIQFCGIPHNWDKLRANELSKVDGREGDRDSETRLRRPSRRRCMHEVHVPRRPCDMTHPDPPLHGLSKGAPPHFNPSLPVPRRVAVASDAWRPASGHRR